MSSPQDAGDVREPAQGNLSTMRPATAALAAPRILNYADEKLRSVINIVQERTGRAMCSWQAAVTVCCNEHADHIILNAPCGSGKTLAFTATLFCCPEDFVVLICPLLSLSSQHCTDLTSAGLTAVEITEGMLANKTLFNKVASAQYQVIITSPEVVTDDASFRRLLKNATFRIRLKRLIVDEFHCIKEWSTFRSAYGTLRDVVSKLPAHVKLLFASATVSDSLRTEIISDFCLRSTETQFIRLRNESPNTFLCVQPMPGALDDIAIFARLLGSEPANLSRDAPPPPKFAIFMPSKRMCETGATFLRSLLPEHHQDKIFSWHAGMSKNYKQEMVEDFKSGKVWGGCVTECGAMGIDVPDIQVVWLWGIEHLQFSALFQRVGRAGRDRSLQAVAVVFVEKRFWLPGTKRTHTKLVNQYNPPVVSIVKDEPIEETVPQELSDEEDETQQPNASTSSSSSSSESEAPGPAKPRSKSQAKKSNVSQNVGASLQKRTRPTALRKATRGAAKFPNLDPAVVDFVSQTPKATLTLAARTHHSDLPTPPALPDHPTFCRRDVGRLHYHCDTVIAPSPETPDCLRCSPPAANFCCDLCLSRALAAEGSLVLPSLVQDTLTLSLVPRRSLPPRRARRSKAMCTDRTAEREDILRADLKQWRADQAQSRFALLDLAAEDVLPDDVLNTLVSLAHRTDKLITIEDVAFHTRWESCRDFADDIISILRATFPLPPSGNRAQSPIEVDALAATHDAHELEPIARKISSSKSTRKQGKCSACGRRDGHRANHVRLCRAQNSSHRKYQPNFVKPEVTPPNSPPESDAEQENRSPAQEPPPREKRPVPVSVTPVSPPGKRYKTSASTPKVFNAVAPAVSQANFRSPFATIPTFSVAHSTPSSSRVPLTPLSPNCMPRGPIPTPYPTASLNFTPPAQPVHPTHTPPPTVPARRLFPFSNSTHFLSIDLDNPNSSDMEE